jgi:hypothetical protein
MKELKKLFYGGRIYTMSDRQPVCDAMIVDRDRISWIGAAAALSSVPSDSYEIIDLDGQIVLPGFIDSHTHLVFWALSRTRIDLDGATSYEDAHNIIRTFVAKQPRKERSLMIGKGWKKEQWQQVRWPHKADLDRIIPDRPVAIFSKDEHLLWVNSVVLKMANINRDTVSPAGGEINRDASGEATGILRDNAMNLVGRLLQPPPAREMNKVMAEGFAQMYRKGCVGVCSFDGINGFETLQSLDIAGKLPVKVVYYLPATLADHAIALKWQSGYGSEWLKIGGVKAFADGALGSQTALMLKPFHGTKHNTGIEATTPEELKRLVAITSKAGLACAIHAIGDKANRNVLDAFEASGRFRSARVRHRIEHCQIIAPEDLKRFASLKLIASMQPSHATADIDLMKLYLGERRKDSYRFRTLAKLGVAHCYGSDAPIEPLDPLAGIYAAVTGKPPGGKTCFNSRETITVEQAVRGFTLGGARAVGEDHQRGSFSAGMKADFAILDRDIMRLRPEAILKATVMATYINGELKYSQEGFLD